MAAAKDDEVHHLSVYDGRHCMGRMIERGRECQARSRPDEPPLGTFPSRKDAVAAISDAYIDATTRRAA